MLPSAQLEDSLIELAPHARLPRLDLGIDWEPRARQFWTSLRSSFAGPRPPTYDDLAKSQSFRVDWVRGTLPGRAFAAASLWHVLVIWILILPIWGFLPENRPTLAPVQIELSWYGEQNLPKIALPARAPGPAAAHRRTDQRPKPRDNRGADAFHPRQSIVSIPVRMTHPRQTLIRPDAPNAPPKIVPQLPNIVEWSPIELPRPKFSLSARMVAPKPRRRAIGDVPAPEVPNGEKNQGPLNLAASRPIVIARPQMPLSAMSAPRTRQRERTTDAAAPEISSAAGAANARNLIALSATPGPPMPLANVPEGNLAARISISPAGTNSGAPTRSAAHGNEAGAGDAPGAGGMTTGGTNGNSSPLPAAVSISGESEPRTGGGGLASAGGHSGTLNLKLSPSYEAAVHTRKGPADLSSFDPSLPPEKILSGSEIYTMHVNLPNVTSASGSWILNFAELDENEQPGYRRRERLANPVPVHVADPKYPPDLIKDHVRGEVVLYAIIRKDGSVDSIQIVHKLDPQLDRNAIDALKQWVFQPATRARIPVDIEAVIHVPFTYQDAAE